MSVNLNLFNSARFTLSAWFELHKKEQNLILISEFNSLVSKEIKSQPTPFIYERIGEKYEHYFIDELHFKS